MGIRQRVKSMKPMYAVMGGAVCWSLGKVARDAVSATRWTIAPGRYSFAHTSAHDSEFSPWGSTWRKIDERDSLRFCSHCRSLHPMDFLSVIEGLERWNPSEAHAEMISLIERGEADPSIVNLNRWRQVPEGSYMMSVFGFDDPDDDPGIHVHTDDVHFSIMLRHVLDLDLDDWEQFSTALTDTCPEIDVSRSGVHWGVQYHPDIDIMSALPPLSMIIAQHPEGE